MCFELDSLPPVPVLSGAAITPAHHVLEAPDGNRLAAFAALPGEPCRSVFSVGVCFGGRHSWLVGSSRR